ncbi:MAG: hypothetical protein WC845_04200 [Candidatus Staskawiczbacteria bacterium]|jgi:hypothetical protein
MFMPKWAIFALKSMIGRKVNLLVHSSAEDLTGGSESSKPVEKTEKVRITFLGIYGVGDTPVYIHGIDQGGNERLFRNCINVCSSEDTGNPNYRGQTTVRRICFIKVGPWFNSLPSINALNAFERRVQSKEPDERYLAEKIFLGQIYYRPPGSGLHYSPCYPVFNDTRFIAQVLAYMDRII